MVQSFLIFLCHSKCCWVSSPLQKASLHSLRNSSKMSTLLGVYSLPRFTLMALKKKILPGCSTMPQFMQPHWVGTHSFFLSWVWLFCGILLMFTCLLYGWRTHPLLPIKVEPISFLWSQLPKPTAPSPASIYIKIKPTNDRLVCSG